MGGSSKREGVDSGRELYGANISGQDIPVNSIFIRRSCANLFEVFSKDPPDLRGNSECFLWLSANLESDLISTKEISQKFVWGSLLKFSIFKKIAILLGFLVQVNATFRPKAVTSYRMLTNDSLDTTGLLVPKLQLSNAGVEIT